jgi:hypothetical protein
MSVPLAAARRPRHPCQDFAASMPATRGLIAAPWTPLASLCSAGARSGLASPLLAVSHQSVPTPVPVVGTGILVSPMEIANE